MSLTIRLERFTPGWGGLDPSNLNPQVQTADPSRLRVNLSYRADEFGGRWSRLDCVRSPVAVEGEAGED
jgi:hypothetical protein